MRQGMAIQGARVAFQVQDALRLAMDGEGGVVGVAARDNNITNNNNFKKHHNTDNKHDGNAKDRAGTSARH